jgi:hypothetical protein
VSFPYNKQLFKNQPICYLLAVVLEASDVAPSVGETYEVENGQERTAGMDLNLKMSFKICFNMF